MFGLRVECLSHTLIPSHSVLNDLFRILGSSFSKFRNVNNPSILLIPISIAILNGMFGLRIKPFESPSNLWEKLVHNSLVTSLPQSCIQALWKFSPVYRLFLLILELEQYKSCQFMNLSNLFKFCGMFDLRI